MDCSLPVCYVRSINQSKLDLVNQNTARVNIDILGISELKWTGTGKFNSEDHSTVGKNPLEEMEELFVNQRV